MSDFQKEMESRLRTLKHLARLGVPLTPLLKKDLDALCLAIEAAKCTALSEQEMTHEYITMKEKSFDGHWRAILGAPYTYRLIMLMANSVPKYLTIKLICDYSMIGRGFGLRALPCLDKPHFREGLKGVHFPWLQEMMHELGDTLVVALKELELDVEHVTCHLTELAIMQSGECTFPDFVTNSEPSALRNRLARDREMVKAIHWRQEETKSRTCVLDQIEKLEKKVEKELAKKCVLAMDPPPYSVAAPEKP